jgi:hypothetical protein
MTLGIMSHAIDETSGLMTFGIMIICIMTLNLMTTGIMTLGLKTRPNDTQTFDNGHNVTAKLHFMS